MADPEDAILLEDVVRRFGDVLAVDGVSFAATPGVIVGLIGPSASGKTTLIRMLTGSLAPTSGRVRVLGRDPRKLDGPMRERLGYVPQHFLLYPDLTASENVSFVAALFGMMWLRRRRRVREVLEMLDLWDARDRRANQLSGGMQRRLVLATALVHDPDILFIDEPTAGVDPIMRARIWDALRALRDAGRTMVVTTQYIAEAEHCDAVGVLSHGRLLAIDEPERLRRGLYGGELIEIRTTRSVNEAALAGVAGVRKVHRRGERALLAVVDDAAPVTPRILDALERQGSTAVSVEPYLPTFDEVFEAIVASDERSAA